MKDKLVTRREVVAGAALVGASMIVPAAAQTRPSPAFVELRAKLDEALATYREAQQARFAARERIGAEMRASENPFRVFTHAPEAKARRRARIAACNAADDLLFANPLNDADAALQIEGRELFYAALGKDDNFPRQRHARR